MKILLLLIVISLSNLTYSQENLGFSPTILKLQNDIRTLQTKKMDLEAATTNTKSTVDELSAVSTIDKIIDDLKNKQKKLETLETNVKKGDAHFENMLALCYFNGEYGYPKDYQKAFSLYNSCAQKNNISCLYKVGLMYKEGWGVGRSNVKALPWLTKAAESGEPAAQVNLFLIHTQDGEGLKPDLNKAIYWLKKANDQNYSEAQFWLGTLYISGDFLEKDTKKGNELLIAAQEQGYPVEESLQELLKKKRNSKEQ